MESLKLYTISDAYISYLREFSPKTILRSEGEGYVTSRKYLGVVYEINCYQYFAPFSSPKDSDYFLGKNGKKEIRRSIIPIIRMTETFSNGEKGLLATIKLNNMIPVPVSELEEYDIDAEPDEKYRGLIQKEMAFVRKNSSLILKNAKVLYSQKTGGKTTAGYLKSTSDFKLLEQKMDEYKPS